MNYTDTLTFLSDLTIIEAIAITLATFICTCITYSILHIIIKGIVDSAKGSVRKQNKDLLDNMNRLDTKSNINQKLTK